MTKSRLEAFSDGVIAIIITIMVLELKVPEGNTLDDLKPVLPIFMSYVLSFFNIAIYWANHHHLLYTVRTVNSKIMWSNTHLLFWLSLTPFGTAYMGEHHFNVESVVLYAILQAMNGFAYAILLKTILSNGAHDELFSEVLRKQSFKGLVSLIIYLAAIAVAFIKPALSGIMFVIVSIMWVIPDKNIERRIDS